MDIVYFEMPLESDRDPDDSFYLHLQVYMYVLSEFRPQQDISVLPAELIACPTALASALSDIPWYLHVI